MQPGFIYTYEAGVNVTTYVDCPENVRTLKIARHCVHLASAASATL
jgi:hypothetical protein